MAAAMPDGMPNKRKRPTVNVVDGIHFRDIEVRWNNISVGGGFNKRRKEQLIISTASFLIPGDTQTTEFFHVAKTEPWFGKLISGQQFLGRGHKNVHIFDLIGGR